MSAPNAASDTPRIFVSHSHADNAYCREFVAALRHALGDDDEAVWYDEHNLGWGNIRRTIERELEQRQHFIAILSPAAVASQWVNDEIDAALGLLREGTMRSVSFVTAEKCDVPRLLRGYKRVEPVGGAGYPPAEAAERVLRFIQPTPAASTPDVPPTQRPTQQTSTAAAQQQRRYTDDLERRGILTPIAMPRERFPEHLEQLGFSAWMAKDPETGKPTALILPPLCPVPAGPFLMGSDPRQDSQMHDDEQPLHQVTLGAYRIGKFPVTAAEYACFTAAGHYVPLDLSSWQHKLDHPIWFLRWKDVRDYAAWLRKLTGRPWWLPSEAEWEKAARWDASGNYGRGIARIYPWGDRFDEARCNTSESEIRGTTAVGAYSPEDPSRDGSSPYGAQDMAGNVWEWTRTIWDDHAYSKRDSRDDDESDEHVHRVLRGGAWDWDARFARAASRLHDMPPDYMLNNFGFRLASAY